MYRFNNGWTIVCDIGLDIYSDGYKEYEAGYANYKARLTKKTHFVYRPPNETMSISMVAEMPGSESRNEDNDDNSLSLSIIGEPAREPRKLSLPADIQAATGHESNA
ncbi:hypothetical protein AAVH_09909 [Aphelenchoides avenae]|nr:hypothetical protein AAVH_09909 [Aphelenchus avenae]